MVGAKPVGSFRILRARPEQCLHLLARQPGPVIQQAGGGVVIGGEGGDGSQAFLCADGFDFLESGHVVCGPGFGERDDEICLNKKAPAGRRLNDIWRPVRESNPSCQDENLES